jgi:hypothetical protein
LIKNNNGEYINDEANRFLYLKDNPNILLIEPAAIIRASIFENVKLQLQMNLAYPLTSKEIEMKNNLFTFGIQVLLPGQN